MKEVGVSKKIQFILTAGLVIVGVSWALQSLWSMEQTDIGSAPNPTYKDILALTHIGVQTHDFGRR